MATTGFAASVVVGGALVRTFGRASAAVQSRIHAVGAALREAEDRANAYGLEIGGATREHRRFRGELDRTDEKPGRFPRRRIRLAGGRRTAAQAPDTAYAASGAVGSAGGVEVKPVYLRTVMPADDRGAEAAAGRTGSAAHFSRNFPAAEAEVPDLRYDFPSVGLPEAASPAGAAIPRRIAAVVGADFDDTGEAIAGADPAEEMARIGEVLTRVRQGLRITGSGQVSEGLAEAAAGAASAGPLFERAAAAIDLVSAAGTAGSRAGAAFTAVLRQLPTAAEVVRASVVRTSEGSIDLAGSLAALRASLPPEGEAGSRAQAIRELFDDEAAEGLAPLLAGFDRYRGGLEAARQHSETFRDDAKRVGGALKEMRSSLTLTDIRMKTLAVGGVIGKAGSALAGLAAGGVKAAIAGFRALGAAIAANPVGLVITGVVLAAALIWKYWTPIRDFLGRVFAPLVEFARPAFDWISARVAAFGGWLLGHWAPVKTFFGSVWSALADGARAAFGLLAGGWEAVKGGFSGLRNAVSTAVGAVVSYLRNFSFVKMGKNLIATLGEGVIAAKDALVEKVGGVFGAVRDLLPFSDAREGPFAALTTSGAAILGTVGAGVRRAGPGPLRRPLRSALGAAAVGLGLPAATAPPDALLRRPSSPPPRTAAARPQVVVSPGAVVLHFHGAAGNPRRVAAEVERQLADLFRNAANEARLLEADSD